MASAFDDMLAADAPAFMDALGGVSATFTPIGGTAATITVLEDYDTEQGVEASAEMSFDTKIVWLQRSDVAAIHCDQTGAGHDKLVLSTDPRTWYVRKILSKDPGMWQLLIADTELPFIQ